MSIERIFILHHTHVDLGYTELSPWVDEALINMVNETLDLVAQHRDRSPDLQFRWVHEASWPISEYLKRADARAEELLNLVRMNPADFIDKYPAELSGGQRQRVGVARALGADPPILLMDEPFGAIDPINRVELQSEFLKIQQQIKKTIIFVTHDIYEAIKMGDRIALMKDGRLVQYNTPANILYHPKDEFVEGFVGADRALKGLQLIRVKDVMKQATPTELKDTVAVKETATDENSVLNEALSLMLSSGLKSLPVVDDKGGIKGILTMDAIQEALHEAIHPKEEAGA